MPFFAETNAEDRHRDREATLGRAPVVAILLGFAGVILTAVLGVIVAAHGSHIWTHVAANGFGFALFGWIGFLVATSRVALSQHTLRFVNVFFSIKMPVERIERLDSKRGLRAVMVGGDIFASSAFGQSVLGNVFGYKRAAHVVERYRKLVANRAASADSPPDVVRSLRDACVWLPAWVLTYVVVASVVSALRG